jgi:hypothetical protein
MTAYVSFTSPPSDSVGDYDLIRKGLSNTEGGDYKMEILGSGKAFCYFRGSSGSESIENGPNLADGAWHKIQCIKTSSSVSLVVDGKQYTQSVTVGSISNSAKLAIGAKAEGGDWYLGLMDEVSITH